MKAQLPLAELFSGDAENDWRHDAACRSLDPTVFFSPDAFENKQEKEEREVAAKAVCTGCRVRDECLDYAIKAGERYGIWGGMTPHERRALLRRRTREADSERVS